MSWPEESIDRELRLLASLFRELVRAGFRRVQMRDAAPCLALTGTSGVVVRVGVDVTGTPYALGARSWRSPSADLAESAKALIAFVSFLDGGGSTPPSGAGVRS